MPSCTTTFTAVTNENTKGSKCDTNIPVIENNFGNSKNCLICGSFVHMTRVSKLSLSQFK